MTIEEIKELLDVFNASGLEEIEVQRGENRVRIRRSGGSRELLVAAAPASVPAPLVAAPHPIPAAPAHAVASSAVAAAPAKASEPDANHLLVKSPIVGTYYEQAAPGSPPFVKVGDAVEPGQVLCIIESMKLMNEIEAEVSGIVAAKLVENGRPVEYGEALFAIRPR